MHTETDVHRWYASFKNIWIEFHEVFALIHLISLLILSE